VNALATAATLVDHARDADSSRPYEERRQIDEIDADVASVIRQQLYEPAFIVPDAYEAMDPASWFGAEANCLILAILSQAPTEPAAIAAFGRLARTLVGWWDEDDDWRANRDEHRRERNRNVEPALSDLLRNFLLRTATSTAVAILQPILIAVDRHPRQIQWLLLGLISVEDREPNTPQFWLLWELFAERIRRATWLAEIDEEHASGGDMMSAIFLGTSWKKEVRHWRSLEGYAWYVHALFEDLPPYSTVLDDYVRFLYHVGEQSLPEAFIRIAHRLQQGDAQQTLRKGNIVFLLELLLQRYVYRRPLELKRHADLRDAVLFLLDLLVENGSSAAFRMRDDFVTPVSTA